MNSPLRTLLVVPVVLGGLSCATTPPVTPAVAPEQVRSSDAQAGAATSGEPPDEVREATSADLGVSWGMTPSEVVKEWSDHDLVPDEQTKVVCASCSSFIAGQEVRSLETLVGFSFCPCNGNPADQCLFSVWRVYRGGETEEFLSDARADAVVVYPADAPADVWQNDDTNIAVSSPLPGVAVAVFASADDVCQGAPAPDDPAEAAKDGSTALGMGMRIATLQTPEGRDASLAASAKKAASAAPGYSKSKRGRRKASQ
jgi:hypothetical protein